MAVLAAEGCASSEGSVCWPSGAPPAWLGLLLLLMHLQLHGPGCSWPPSSAIQAFASRTYYFYALPTIPKLRCLFAAEAGLQQEPWAGCATWL